MKKNNLNIILLLILSLTKSVIQLNDFPSSGWLLVLRIMIFLTSIILSFIIIKTWKYKLLTIGLIIIISMGQGQLKLWKIPAKNYIVELIKDHDKPIKLILGQDSIRTIHYSFQCRLLVTKGLNYTKDSIIFSGLNKQLLIQFLKNSEIKEIEKNQFGTLFIMSRFIDNGYGLFHATPENIAKLLETKRFRINMYDVTGYTKIWENWYYLSFT